MRCLVLAIAAAAAIAGCSNSSGEPAAVASPSQATSSAPAPSTAPTNSSAVLASPEAVLAARALRRDAAAFREAFTAWISGGSGVEAAALATTAAMSARSLSVAATADASVLGATGVASSSDDYAAFFERSAVLTGQGETAYAATEAAAGDVDCFKERAHDLWLTAAERYLGADYAEPPVPRDGVCDAGFGTP